MMKGRRFGATGIVLLAAGVAGIGALTAATAAAGGQGATMTRLFAPVDIGGGSVGAARFGAPRAEPHHRRRPRDGCGLSATGLGRQPRDAALPGRRQERRGTGRARLLPAQQGPVVAHRRRPAVRGRCAPQARRRQLLSSRRDPGGSRGLAGRARRPGPRRRHRVLHHHPPRSGRPVHQRALQRGVPGSARPCRGAPARRRPRHRGADAAALPGEPRGRVRDQRLLRQRRGVDGARLDDRTDHRTL